ncbi:hypothetical protein PS685_05157 [Pseudomonas fluorescens]|uniref:Uncharacterized protein n=1 Tax=Pseudomonas fluorescens TaxID=294 RepID=A0A5E7A2S9_PSEFL|nr:hypothetical protein PS685_05157 [Pseudomonas fluorescens]
MVEIIQAAADRQILAPPVGVALEGDAAPGVDLGDLVRAAAQWRLVTAATGEISGLPPVLGKYWQGRNVQGQGTVLVVLEVETHGAWRLHFDALDVGELRAITQAALGHQQVEGVAHVFGGDRLAIGKPGLGVEVETQGQAVIGALHRLRHQAVDGVRLVQRALGQGRIDQAVDLRHADALVDVRQDMVEMADFNRRTTHGAALGGLQVGVGKMTEVGGILGRFAIHGQRMLRRCIHPRSTR